MQIFIKGASESIVAILLAHNGFLCTQATGRLAKIIFPSCLARLQLRNKLLVEARRRLLIIEASHPDDLFFPCYPFFSPPLQLHGDCCDRRKRNNLFGGSRGHIT